MQPASENKLLLTYYGDDFTGSTDCLEALSLAGVRAVLLFGPPTVDTLARFPGVQAMGVAGVGRSLTPVQMDEQLPPIFAAIKQLAAPVVHYKTCSTFDSSPAIGSIGRAIELGRAAFGAHTVAVVVGVPALGRYCAFGNLFARAGSDGQIYRLDRHPTMSRHPVTPMHEADLRLHLAQQTRLPIGLIDFTSLASPLEQIEAGFAAREAAGDRIVLFDSLTEAHLATIGGLLWRRSQVAKEPLFVVGSSGVDYALAAHWRAAGMLPQHVDIPKLQPAKQILAVSGSCSPVTEQQIACAVKGGFVDAPLPVEAWANRDPISALERFVTRVLQNLREGKSVVVHTAKGASDGRIAAARQLFANNKPIETPAALAGQALATVVRAAVENAGLRRVVVAGGDTSGYLAGALGITALQFAAPIAPGVPLCRASAADRSSPFDGLEIAFKGGQVGQSDFFMRMLHGAAGA